MFHMKHTIEKKKQTNQTPNVSCETPLPFKQTILENNQENTKSYINKPY